MLKCNLRRAYLLGLLLISGCNISAAANATNPAPLTTQCPCDFNLEEAKKIFTSLASGHVTCAKVQSSEFKDGKLISSNLTYGLNSAVEMNIADTKPTARQAWVISSEPNNADFPRYCVTSINPADLTHSQKILITNDAEYKSCLETLEHVITSLGIVCGISFD